MLKKTMTYVDFDGNERTEPFYFNLTEAELMEMELSTEGGLEQFIQKITAEKDNRKIVSMFKELVLKAYGEKSPDGKRFEKSEDISKNFASTQAYSDLFMELATDAKAGADFVKGILPTKLAQASDKLETTSLNN